MILITFFFVNLLNLSYFIQNCDENCETGMDYMRQAACSGNRASMIFLAKAYDTGINVRLVFSRSLLFKSILIYSYFIIVILHKKYVLSLSVTKIYLIFSISYVIHLFLISDKFEITWEFCQCSQITGQELSILFHPFQALWFISKVWQ